MRRYGSLALLAGLVSASLLVVPLSPSWQPVSLAFDSPIQGQQVAPFLVTPYYDALNINAYFDHRYPTYDGYPNSTYPNVVRYDGLDLPSCDYVGQPGHICYDGHNGTDFDLSYERVIAAADGVAVSEQPWHVPDCHDGSNCGYGLYVDIDHGNGYVTRYGHLSALAVNFGQTVHQGQIIGTSGNTGYSTGSHLHFGVYHDGVAVDPFGWSGAGADPWEQYSGVASEWLWADGQWAGHPLPEPRTTTPITLDDGDPGFEKGDQWGSCPPGSCPYWHYAIGVGTNGDMWWTNVNYEEDYWARWQPSFPFAGFYEVYVFVPRDNATSWEADFAIHHPDGTQQTTVGQWGTYDRWLCLGLYRFDAGSSPSGAVSISDYTGEDDLSRKLGVDAARFVPRAPVFLPVVLKNHGG